jgi:O-antigen/teichoic acid export membrane protein
MLRLVIHVFTNDVFAFLLGALSAVIVAHLLGPEGRGAVVMAIVVAKFAMALTQFGLPHALTYNLSRAGGGGEALAGALAVCLRLVPVTLLCVTGLYALAYQFGHDVLLHGMSESLVLASYLYAVGVIFQEILMQTLLGLHDFRGRNLLGVLPPLLIFLTLAAFWATGAAFDGVTVAFVYVLATAGTVLYGSWQLLRKYRPRLTWRAPEGWKSSYVVFGLQFSVALIAQLLNYRLDTMIVNGLLGTAAVGLYATGVTVTEMLLFVPASVNYVLYTRAAALQGEDRDQMTVLALGATLYLVLAEAAGALLLFPVLIPLVFGKDFAPSVAPALWLLPGMVSITVVKLLSHSLAGAGRPGCATLTNLIGLSGTVVLDILLIPRLGIVGAALASSLAYSISALTITVLYVRNTRMPLRRLAAEVILAAPRHLRERLLARGRRVSAPAEVGAESSGGKSDAGSVEVVGKT